MTVLLLAAESGNPFWGQSACGGSALGFKLRATPPSPQKRSTARGFIGPTQPRWFPSGAGAR